MLSAITFYWSLSVSKVYDRNSTLKVRMKHKIETHGGIILQMTGDWKGKKAYKNTFSENWKPL